ncbi:MAG: hypothetical protein KC478_07720, partial [Bacteriovoracaceae bacterium]|nr:hypothetical protein [Bacteriovoracaceae bacterium]
EHGLFKAQIAYNDIGWRILGAKGGNTGLIFSDWKASIDLAAVDGFIEGFFNASDIVAFREVKYLELKRGNTIFKSGDSKFVKVEIKKLFLDLNKKHITAQFNSEGGIAFYLKGESVDGVFRAMVTFKDANRVDASWEFDCNLKECPPIFMEGLKNKIIEIENTSD